MLKDPNAFQHGLAVVVLESLVPADHLVCNMGVTDLAQGR